MNDNRLTVRLTKYWENLKKDDVIPDFRKNNPARIEDLWEQCFVLSISTPDSTSYKYEYLGEKIKKIYGEDLTGMTFSSESNQFSNSLISPKLQMLNALVSTQSPVEDSGQIINNNGNIIKYRTVLLPFGNKKSGLTHIVTGVSYREF